MAPSVAFERTTEAVVRIVDVIPHGRVTTYGAIGASIGVDPRYVALIMATAEDVASAPWWRVVSSGGVLRTKHWREHRRHLEDEGLHFEGNTILDFDTVFDPLV